MSLWTEARTTMAFARDLRAFWRAPRPLDPGAHIRARLAQRQDAFLQMVGQRIFGNPGNPYLKLLAAAGIALEDIERLAAQVGVEGCLQHLHEAGVFVALDEFKGRRPIRRLGLDLAVGPADFRAARGGSGWSGVSGGSRTRGTPLPISVLGRLNALPAYDLHARAHDYVGRPWAQWWAAPPGAAGIGHAETHLKLAQPLSRWYSPTHPGPGPASGKSVAVTWTAVLVSGLMGHRIPYPRYMPIDRADVIARWLARQGTLGRHLVFDTMPSAAVRIALAARSLGLDISGHIMRTGGEPLTPAKVAVLERAGLRYCSQYVSAETRAMGLSCGDGVAPDDMHLLTDRLAFVQVPKHLDGWPEPVGALFVTCFSAYMALVLVNLELGDYGVLEERECGCPLGAAGLHTHLHTIRSYEKLTSVGMHFMGADLHDLLEVALPGRFGGGPIDYQFVESERDGQTSLALVVSPTVGPLDEREVIAFTLSELERRTKAGRMMTDIWRQGGVLRLERAAPHITRAAKIQPLHVEQTP